MKRLLAFALTLALAACAQPVLAQTITPVTPLASPAVSAGWVAASNTTNAYHLSVTSGASAGYLLVFDAIAIPADGAVTPKLCRAVAANATLSTTFSSPAAFRNGIVMVFSTTGCYTKTASATAFFEASFK